MTLRTKTVEYVFDMRTTNLAASTRHDFASQTLTIAENSSRTIRSAHIEIHARDANSATSTRGSVASWLIGIKLGAVAFDDVTVTDTVTDSGEQQCLVFTRDVTSYFVSNFGSGTTQTSQVGWSFTNTGTSAISLINITAKLVITYEFDDASATTRTKTVRIPIESLTGALTASLAEFGTNQVPLLDTFLPEAGKAYKQVWFEIFGNESNAAATNSNLCVALDAEAEVQFGAVEQANISAVWDFCTWIRNDMTTSATHAFKARTTNTANPWNHLGVVLCVTYTYDHSSSTRILQSLLLPLKLSDLAAIPGTTSAEQQVVRKSIDIQEPGTINLRQSGAVLFWEFASNLAANPSVGVGGQTARAYTSVAGTVTVGQFSLVHRFDSGGAAGSGLSIARGANSLDVELFASSAANFLTCPSSYILLNYESDKHASGDGVHAHSTCWNQRDTAADETVLAFTGLNTPNIPETNYYLVSVGLVAPCIINASTLAVGNTSIGFELGSGELQQDGWFIGMNGTRRSGNELNLSTFCGDFTSGFKRYPNDPRGGANIETSRRYLISTMQPSWKSMQLWVTYHAISYSVSGNITNSNGGAMTAYAHRADDKSIVDSAGRTGNGAFGPIVVYDNTTNYYTEVQEDGTHKARSADTAAS